MAKKPSKLVFTLNKLSTVTLTVLRKGTPGAHALGALRLRPRTPSPSGRAGAAALAVRLRAVDLAGNARRHSPGGSRCRAR